MDAYDIFRKLTRGVKFDRTKIPRKQPTQPKPRIITEEDRKPLFDDIVIKDELFDDSQTGAQYGDLLVDVKEEPEDEESQEITLLGGIVSNTDGKQQLRKQKKAMKLVDRTRLKKLQEEEEVAHLRKLDKIRVGRGKVPKPIMQFSELPLKADLIENIAKCGYNEPTPVQKQALPILLQGRSLLACAPTGSGKTAAFLLPIIHHLEGPQRVGFRALIICPTRELAKQTQRECVRLSGNRGLRIHLICKINRALNLYGPKSSKRYDILVTTPNRLIYLLSQDPPAISLAQVKWLIVDEADKLFEESVCSFREQFDQIMHNCTNEALKIGMFSATYTPVVAQWCRSHMKNHVSITVGHRNAATETVDQELMFVGSEDGKLMAFRDIVRKGLTPPVLIFVQSKERAQQLFSELIYDGINVDAIHADRTQVQRDNTVRSFREGKIWVLICTELMARGIDFKGVSLVINFDFPTSAISYVHRIGRAGRAGRRGKAITFFTVDDVANLRSIAHVLKQSGCKVPEYMLKLKRQSKFERKRLLVKAPQREDILTVLNRRNKNVQPKEHAEKPQIMAKHITSTSEKKESIKDLEKKVLSGKSSSKLPIVKGGKRKLVDTEKPAKRLRKS